MAGAGLLNAVLDPFLIFGLGPFPELGIAGAAWATVTAWSVGFVYQMHLLVIQRELVSATCPLWRPSDNLAAICSESAFLLPVPT